MSYELVRQVRFSINPFNRQREDGANAYASCPCGEGLCFFFGLWIHLTGDVDPNTGFVINVVEMDQAVRDAVVPLFIQEIDDKYDMKHPVSFPELTQLLKDSWRVLQRALNPSKVSCLSLDLSPYRTLSLPSEDTKMYEYCEKFEFAAMHTLWNDDFSEEKNFEVFGKCANPTGHGHNYILEVSVMSLCEEDFAIGEFQYIVDKEFIEIIDHKNLNEDLEVFKKKIPTVENLAWFAWQTLWGKFKNTQLNKVTVWETDKTYCSYRK